MSGCWRSTWIIHALSLPDDHDTKHFGIWLPGHLVIWSLVIDLLIESHSKVGGDMSQQSEVLKERTMLFAINVLKLIDRFPETAGARVIAYQLAKCSTSVGANYRSACNGRSRAEFIAKLG